MDIRKLQATATIYIGFSLIKNDGSQAVGVTLSTISSRAVAPDGTALTPGVDPAGDYDEATFTEPHSNGDYLAAFSSSATRKLFTSADQANPYRLTFDSSEADVELMPKDIWVVSMFSWEAANLARAMR